MSDDDRPPQILARLYDAERRRPATDPQRIVRVVARAQASAETSAAVARAALISGATGLALGLTLGALAVPSSEPPTMPPPVGDSSTATVDASAADAGVPERALVDAATVSPFEVLAEPPSPATEHATSTRRLDDRDTALAEERRLVDTMREALARSDASSCLSMADRHARLFPHGTLAEERSALRIRALAMLGRHPEAEAALTRFSVDFPESPLWASLSREIGGETNGSGSTGPINP